MLNATLLMGGPDTDWDPKEDADNGLAEDVDLLTNHHLCNFATRNALWVPFGKQYDPDFGLAGQWMSAARRRPEHTNAFNDLNILQELEDLGLKDIALECVETYFPANVKNGFIPRASRQLSLRMFYDHAKNEGKYAAMNTVKTLQERALAKPWVVGEKPFITNEIFKSIFQNTEITNSVLPTAQGHHKTLVFLLKDIISLKRAPWGNAPGYYSKKDISNLLQIVRDNNLVPSVAGVDKTPVTSVKTPSVPPEAPSSGLTKEEVLQLMQDYASSFSQFDYTNKAHPHLEHFDSFAAISEFLLQRSLGFLGNDDQFLGVLWMARELKDRFQKKECHYEWFFLFLERINILLSDNRESTINTFPPYAQYQNMLSGGKLDNGQKCWWSHDDFKQLSLSTGNHHTQRLASAKSFIEQFPSVVYLPITQELDGKGIFQNIPSPKKALGLRGLSREKIYADGGFHNGGEYSQHDAQHWALLRETLSSVAIHQPADIEGFKKVITPEFAELM